MRWIAVLRTAQKIAVRRILYAPARCIAPGTPRADMESAPTFCFCRRQKRHLLYYFLFIIYYFKTSFYKGT